MAIGTPRLDNYTRLLHRLYEPMFCLKILTGSAPLGPHLVANYEPNNPISVRRRFLKNLAYFCDFRKGGETTASIAVEEREHCFVFWLALNDGNRHASTQEDSSVGFLTGVLTRLQHLLVQSDIARAEAETEFLEYCVVYASSRITKEAKALSFAMRKSIELLRHVDGAGGKMDIFLQEDITVYL